MTRDVNDINELGLGIGSALVINRNGEAITLGRTNKLRELAMNASRIFAMQGSRIRLDAVNVDGLTRIFVDGKETNTSRLCSDCALDEYSKRLAMDLLSSTDFDPEHYRPCMIRCRCRVWNYGKN